MKLIKTQFIKSAPIIFFLITILFLSGYPSMVLAGSREKKLVELTNQLIDISLAISLLQEQIEELINASQPLHPLGLANYLKGLFEAHQIVLDKNDFFEPTEDPYLAFAKILNLVSDSSQDEQRITQKQAEQISEQFLLIKDKILFDGLYGKIDMHEHYRTGGNIEEFLKAAGSLGISKILFVPTGLAPDNQGYKTHQAFLVKYVKKLYPEKIIAFCTIDEADPEAAEVLEECLQAGGQGLKLLGGHPNFYDEPLDSENMYKVYQKAAEYKVPILVHASIINAPQTKYQLDRVYSDFPEITFIHAHYCSAIMAGINLDQCAKLLGDHPNLYIDLSMGGGIKRYHRYFREDLETIKDFVLKYQDRILFGSDIILDRRSIKNFDWLYDRLGCDIDLHEKSQYTCAFGEKDLTHQGFNLDKSILKKLYFENPKKVLNF